MNEIKKEIVKKLTRWQVFFLCVLSILALTVMVIVVAQNAPEQLAMSSSWLFF